MSFDQGLFWRSCLRAILGEVGDKTFFLTAILAGWCPWSGLRRGGNAGVQRCLVFAGAYAALVVRVILLIAVRSEVFQVSKLLLATCVCLVLLACKAGHDLSQADDHSPRGRPSVQDEDLAPADGWNTAAFSSLPPPREPEPEQYPAGYGAVVAKPSPADGVLSEGPSEETVSAVLAFVVPLVVGYLAEAEDRSQTILVVAEHQRVTVICGAVLGLVPAVLTAVLGGWMFHAYASELRALFAYAVAFVCMGLHTFSQALLSMSPSQVNEKASLLHLLERFGL